jgi:hypothetical protein
MCYIHMSKHFMNDQPADTRLQAFSLFGYATLVGIASVGGYIVFNKPSPIMLRVAASKGGVGREATVVGDESDASTLGDAETTRFESLKPWNLFNRSR